VIVERDERELHEHAADEHARGERPDVDRRL
jgi:hypothetical protein